MNQETLKSILDYNPSTGEFVWRKRMSKRGVLGKIAGTTSRQGYIHINTSGKCYMAHRLAWLYVHGELPKGSIDHIDMNKANNSISNLRLATLSENQWNTKAYASNKLGVKGVYKQYGKYKATIKKYGKANHLGSFDTVEEASKAYQDAAKTMHGRFAPSSA